MARSECLWLDSDVLLDWLCDRQPWAAAADELIDLALDGHCELWLSALTLANVFYIHRKQAGTAAALAELRTLTQLVRISAMDQTHVNQALASGRMDFEDELQMASASGVIGLTTIITRNLGDYAHGPVPAMTAGDWLRTRQDL